MLDRWIEGSAKRVSPEAPIPILKEEAQHEVSTNVSDYVFYQDNT